MRDKPERTDQIMIPGKECLILIERRNADRIGGRAGDHHGLSQSCGAGDHRREERGNRPSAARGSRDAEFRDLLDCAKYLARLSADSRLQQGEPRRIVG